HGHIVMQRLETVVVCARRPQLYRSLVSAARGRYILRAVSLPEIARLHDRDIRAVILEWPPDMSGDVALAASLEAVTGVVRSVPTFIVLSLTPPKARDVMLLSSCLHSASI